MADKDAAIKQALEELRNKERRDTMAEAGSPIKGAIVTIKVFGVGGGGNSALERMAESDFPDIDLVAVNTDANALKYSNIGAIKTVQIGDSLTKGRGTGGNVMVGEQAAKNDAARLKSMMLGADMIFITAGMGGGVGTGAAPIIAKLAKEQGMLTVGVVTIPFTFEGARKQRIANQGIIKMQSYMDALITVKNDNLLKLQDNKKLSVVDAFHAADSVLQQSIKCMAEMILSTGVINVDFADVTTIFRQSESSDAILGIGVSDVSALKAVQQALQTPLIDRSLKGARGVILNITGDESLPMYEVDEAAKYIFSQTAEDVNIILGTVIDPKMKGKVQATIIATDFANSLSLKAPTIEVPKSKAAVSNGFNLDAPKFTPPPPPKANKNGGGFPIPSFSIFKPRGDNDKK